MRGGALKAATMENLALTVPHTWRAGGRHTLFCLPKLQI